MFITNSIKVNNEGFKYNEIIGAPSQEVEKALSKMFGMIGMICEGYMHGRVFVIESVEITNDDLTEVYEEAYRETIENLWGEADCPMCIGIDMVE